MKKGISLIVLVITIIVMIILAASVVITLSNTGVIGRASQAVDLTNAAAVQDLAALTWADAYMDNKRGTDLVNEVTTKLGEQGVTVDKWNITVTDTGVSVEKKLGSTLGSLITSGADYGKTIDYTVTVDGTEHKEWQVLYEDEVNGYVYIISSSPVEEHTTLNEGITVASLTADEKALYEKFRVGSWPKYTLIDIDKYGSTMTNCQRVAQLIRNYSSYANTTTYGENYVIGAIGGPTIELFTASWNAQEKTPTIAVTTGEYGYKMNGDTVLMVTSDDFLVPSAYYYWLASPNDMYSGASFYAGDDPVLICDAIIGEYGFGDSFAVRPVVCLLSNIPAVVGDTTDFSLLK